MKRQIQDFRRRERIRGTKYRPRDAAIGGEKGTDIRTYVKRIVSQIIRIDDDGIHGDIWKSRGIDVCPNRGRARSTIHSLKNVACRTRAAHGARAKARENHVGDVIVIRIHGDSRDGTSGKRGCGDTFPRRSTIGRDFDLPEIRPRINRVGIAWRRRDGGKIRAATRASCRVRRGGYIR